MIQIYIFHLGVWNKYSKIWWGHGNKLKKNEIYSACQFRKWHHTSLNTQKRAWKCEEKIKLFSYQIIRGKIQLSIKSVICYRQYLSACFTHQHTVLQMWIQFGWLMFHWDKKYTMSVQHLTGRYQWGMLGNYHP